LSWGVSIYIATQEKNLIQLPYPVHLVAYCRNWVIQKINTTILSKEANGFALALLLGVKSDLNKELLQAYTQLGIIHLVAISGMHLEIIFKNLTRITKWMPRKKIYLLLELIVVLAGVWLYTLMAFGSPSIVRASVFFSIYFIGKFLQQSSITLNTIAGGLLILLLFDVKGIENIGLQLSYAAVIGIHLFYPLLNKMLPMDNPVLSFLWSNLCISFAAQMQHLQRIICSFDAVVFCKELLATLKAAMKVLQ
jgi:competence protein ComEC